MSENEEQGGRKMELLMGLLIAVFAAILAINDLGGGRYGDDEKMANDAYAQQYSWLQSKSIKQSLASGQVELLKTMEKAKAIAPAYKAVIDSYRVVTDAKIVKYSKDMKEIQWGSDSVGKENWSQDDANHEFGKIIGAEQYKAKAATLGDAGDKFDLGTLFLQLCLVLGAIGLVIQEQSTRKMFLFLMLGLGAIGAFYTISAYTLAWSV